ncbi:MAG: ribosome modulation factor [Pseudomonadales bacterium]|nr:ribosome modulation factor [Pseudomonadales bacterium]NRA14433.1 ribosome modulation factor [Oceanospirillaceae bacterium]
MKRQKRDNSSILFSRGFSVGLSGKSKDLCPVNSDEKRSQWLGGWREGREAHWDGMGGVSAIQVTPAMH